MPHACTECGRTFADGSQEMLDGCPECGGNKFRFQPADSPTEDDAQASARRDVIDEDVVSASAVGSTPAPSGQETTAPETDRAPRDLDELRAELDSQFESIKILEPGQYELNLMGLYDRETYIISLQEDGRYVIDVPESWHGSPP